MKNKNSTDFYLFFFIIIILLFFQSIFFVYLYFYTNTKKDWLKLEGRTTGLLQAHRTVAIVAHMSDVCDEHYPYGKLTDTPSKWINPRNWFLRNICMMYFHTYF